MDSEREGVADSDGRVELPVEAQAFDDGAGPVGVDRRRIVVVQQAVEIQGVLRAELPFKPEPAAVAGDVGVRIAREGAVFV